MLLILRGDGTIAYASENLAAALPMDEARRPPSDVDGALVLENRSFWDLILERFSAFIFIEGVAAKLLTRDGELPVMVSAQLAPVEADGTFTVMLHIKDCTTRIAAGPGPAAMREDFGRPYDDAGSDPDEDQEILTLANIGRSSRLLVHEILNPLAVIIGTLDIVDSRMRGSAPADPADRLEQNARLRRAANQILRVTRSVARLAGNRSANGASSANVAEAIDLVVDWYGPELAQRGIVIGRGKMPGKLDEEVAVGCPQHVLVQVLTNLLMNSRDAILSTVAQSEGRVDIRVCRIGGFVEITVIDSGGAPARDASKRTGFGIGLKVCRQVLAAHGGSLLSRIHETPTRFVIVLPFGK